MSFTLGAEDGTAATARLVAVRASAMSPCPAGFDHSGLNASITPKINAMPNIAQTVIIFILSFMVSAGYVSGWIAAYRGGASVNRQPAIVFQPSPNLGSIPDLYIGEIRQHWSW